MNQIFLGAVIPFSIAVILYLVRGGKASFRMLVLIPSTMLIGILLAVFPDVPRLFGRMDLYHEWAKDSRMNIFLWHHTIDLVEKDNPWYTLGMVFMALSLLTMAWLELKRTEDG